MLLLLVLGFLALGVEVSQLLLEHRKQQSVADSAAVAAAAVLGTSSDPQTEARAVAGELGYRNGVNGVVVSAAAPSSGAHAGDANYVEVQVQRSITPALIQLYRKGAFTVRARAMGKRGQSLSACLMALATSGTAIDIANNVTLSLPGCGAISNSNSNSAVNLGSNATLDGTATVVGSVFLGSGAKVTGVVNTGADATLNPYASFNPARLTTPRTAPSNPTTQLQPGVYAQGWSFANNAVVSLAPGQYWVQTRLITQNNVTITGTGVTIVIDGSYAMSIGNGTILTLSAPTTGTTTGLVFYSPATNNSSTAQTFGNNSALNLTGALYFPSQRVVFGNNSAAGASSCTQVVAWAMTFNGNGTFRPDCTGTTVAKLGNTGKAGLVE